MEKCQTRNEGCVREKEKNREQKERGRERTYNRVKEGKESFAENYPDKDLSLTRGPPPSFIPRAGGTGFNGAVT